jgi:hypothetical protein
MTHYRRITMALFAIALVTVGIAGPARAEAPRADVVREADIQSRIDQKVGGEAADRQAIQDLLKRADVKKIAGNAGIDIGRASASVGLLSGAELRDIAAQANELNGTTGGVEHVTLAVTTIIIILLLIIILAN